LAGRLERRELREHFEPNAYARNGKLDGAAVAGEWEAFPAPLPSGLPPVAPFDPEMLPGPLRAWVLDIAERMQVPLDYVAVGAVTVAASLVGRKIGIRPKRYDDWLVVAVLWAGIVGPPSTLQSPALAEITRPLDRLVAEAREAHAEATDEHEAEVAAVEATKAALKKEIEWAAKAHVKTGDRSELDHLIARQRDAKPPKPPTERRYKTSDPTVEKLAELLKDNPRGILVQRDELTGWLRSLDRQGREVDRAFYLEAWNGTNSYSVDRIGRGTLHVPALCVSILGGIQPGPLSSYVHEASRGGVGADGLLQRFQLLVWPDPPRGKWRNVDRYPDADAKNCAYAVYQALDVLSPQEAGATAEEREDISTVRFSSDAQGVFDAWREELEAKLRDGDESTPALTSHLAKYRSLMPALALVFHLIAVADGMGREVSVGVEAATRAAAWCEYLETGDKVVAGTLIFTTSVAIGIEAVVYFLGP
jgi:putative DNA primase/helicase